MHGRSSRPSHLLKNTLFHLCPLIPTHKFLKLKGEAAVAPSGQFMIGVFSYRRSVIFTFDFKKCKNLMDVTVLHKNKLTK